MASILRKFRQAQEAAQQPQAGQKRIFNLNDQQFHQFYTQSEPLGRGAFAQVFKGISIQTGQEVAIKVIAKNNIDSKVEALRQEVKILMNIKHPNIVNMIDVFEDDDRVYLVMELMKGGELFDKIVRDHPNGYSEKRASGIVKNILEAVKYLHGKGIIHRDLKPENLLFTDNAETSSLKISDFGLAKIWSGDMLVRSACGSPNYVSPEVLLNEMQGYTFAVDLWSVGVIVYVMLCGFCPFYDDNTAALFRAITSGSYSFPSPYWDCVSVEAKNFVRQLLVVNPQERLDADGALRHPWIQKSAAEKPMTAISENLRKFKQTRSSPAMLAEDDESEDEH